MKTLKLKSLQSLSVISNPGNSDQDKWAQFLKDNGHNSITFNYLPEHLKLSLKFSFAKKK